MEIVKWKKTKQRRDGGQMVRVTPTEALEIIASLTAQMLSGSPNTDRKEFTVGTEYFSIAVHQVLSVRPDAGRADVLRPTGPNFSTTKGVTHD